MEPMDTIKEYIKQDIEHLTMEELGDAYKLIRLMVAGKKKPGVSQSGLGDGVKCLGCLKADALLGMALAVARGRLLKVTNAEHDKVFDEIARYLEEKHPYKGGCPGLD